MQKVSLWSLSGLLIGGTGLSLNLEDRRNKKNVEAFDNISKEIKESRTRTSLEMERKDSIHDQEIIKLTTEISILGMRQDLHAQETGHKRMVEEIFLLKSEMGKLEAGVVWLTQQGRITLQLDQVRADTEKLQVMVEQLRQETSNS